MKFALQSCESLWLPPCPACSSISFWRPLREDRLEKPTFHLARHTTEREKVNHYILTGCQHAQEVGHRRGPAANRLKAAILWRKKAADLLQGMFDRGYSDEQRRELIRRLSHPDSLFEGNL